MPPPWRRPSRPAGRNGRRNSSQAGSRRYRRRRSTTPRRRSRSSRRTACPPRRAARTRRTARSCAEPTTATGKRPAPPPFRVRRVPLPSMLVLARLVEELAVQLEVGLVVLGVVRRELELRLVEPVRFLGLGLFVALHCSLSVVSVCPLDGTRRHSLRLEGNVES